MSLRVVVSYVFLTMVCWQLMVDVLQIDINLYRYAVDSAEWLQPCLRDFGANIASSLRQFAEWMWLHGIMRIGYAIYETAYALFLPLVLLWAFLSGINDYIDSIFGGQPVIIFIWMLAVLMMFMVYIVNDINYAARVDRARRQQ